MGEDDLTDDLDARFEELFTRFAPDIRHDVHVAELPRRRQAGSRRARTRVVRRAAVGVWLVGLAIAVTVVVAHVGRGPTKRQGPPATTPGETAVSGSFRLQPGALTVAPDGSLLIADVSHHQVLRLLANGQLEVVAGDGRQGSSGDGGPALAAELDDPIALAVGRDGTVYIVDAASGRVRAVSPAGIIRTVAAGRVTSPQAVAVGPDGLVYVAGDEGVLAVSPSGSATTVVAGGPGALFGGTTALFPDALAFEASGALVMADSSPKLLLQRSQAGAVRSLGQTYVAAGGLATATDGSVLVADYGRFAVSRVTASGVRTVVSFLDPSMPAGIRGLRPSGVAVAPDGDIYVSTSGTGGGGTNAELVVVDPAGHVSIVTTSGLMTQSGPLGAVNLGSGKPTTLPPGAVVGGRARRPIVVDGGAVVIDPPPNGVVTAVSERSAESEVGAAAGGLGTYVAERDGAVLGEVWIASGFTTGLPTYHGQLAWVGFLTTTGYPSYPGGPGCIGPSVQMVVLDATTGHGVLDYSGSQGSPCGAPRLPTVTAAIEIVSIPWTASGEKPDPSQPGYVDWQIRYTIPPCGVVFDSPGISNVGSRHVVLFVDVSEPMDPPARCAPPRIVTTSFGPESVSISQVTHALTGAT